MNQTAFKNSNVNSWNYLYSERYLNIRQLAIFSCFFFYFRKGLSFQVTLIRSACPNKRQF